MQLCIRRSARRLNRHVTIDVVAARNDVSRCHRVFRRRRHRDRPDRTRRLVHQQISRRRISARRHRHAARITRQMVDLSRRHRVTRSRIVRTRRLNRQAATVHLKDAVSRHTAVAHEQVSTRRRARRLDQHISVGR